MPGKPLQLPNLKTVIAKDLEEIGIETARIIEALSPDATMGVSGGETYRTILAVWREALGPVRVKLFPVDERMVPFDSPESNWGMIRQSLLQPLDWPQTKRCFLKNMDECAAEGYDKLLRLNFRGAMPRFDLIFLGVGLDGHTASLFPGGQYLDDIDSWVLQTESPASPKDRITLGMGAICAARQLVIVITGEEKRPVVERMLKGDEALPIVRILKNPVEKLLFLDQDAAGE